MTWQRMSQLPSASAHPRHWCLGAPSPWPQSYQVRMPSLEPFWRRVRCRWRVEGCQDCTEWASGLVPLCFRGRHTLVRSKISTLTSCICWTATGWWTKGEHDAEKALNNCRLQKFKRDCSVWTQSCPKTQDIIRPHQTSSWCSDGAPLPEVKSVCQEDSKHHCQSQSSTHSGPIKDVQNTRTNSAMTSSARANFRSPRPGGLSREAFWCCTGRSMFAAPKFEKELEHCLWTRCELLLGACVLWKDIFVV